MVSKNLTINIKSGLHARPAGVLSKAATQCACDVKLLVGQNEIQVKSILNIMVAAVKCGTEVTLVCDGKDEVESLEMLSELIESGLGEKE